MRGKSLAVLLEPMRQNLLWLIFISLANLWLIGFRLVIHVVLQRIISHALRSVNFVVFLDIFRTSLRFHFRAVRLIMHGAQLWCLLRIFLMVHLTCKCFSFWTACLWYFISFLGIYAHWTSHQLILSLHWCLYFFFDLLLFDSYPLFAF